MNKKHTDRWQVVYIKTGVKEINLVRMNRCKLAQYKLQCYFLANTITKLQASYHGGNFQPAEQPLTLSNRIPQRQNLLIITSALSDIKADHNNEHVAEYDDVLESATMTTEDYKVSY